MNDYGADPTGPLPGDFDEREAWFVVAQNRVATPGALLQLYAVILVTLFAMWGGLSLFSPLSIINPAWDRIEESQKGQGAQQQQQQQLPPREDAAKQLRIQGPIEAAIGIACGVVIFIGGARMKELRSYGWAVAGSIVAIFPGLCCCCTGLIPGLWALLVLLNPDVKLAFTKNATPTAEQL
jgi:hypothetical protein